MLRSTAVRHQQREERGSHCATVQTRIESFGVSNVKRRTDTASHIPHRQFVRHNPNLMRLHVGGLDGKRPILYTSDDSDFKTQDVASDTSTEIRYLPFNVLIVLYHYYHHHFARVTHHLCRPASSFFLLLLFAVISEANGPCLDGDPSSRRDRQRKAQLEGPEWN